MKPKAAVVVNVEGIDCGRMGHSCFSDVSRGNTYDVINYLIYVRLIEPRLNRWS